MMTCTAGNALLLDSQAVCLPMPPLTLAPTVWFLGAHMLQCIQDSALKKAVETRGKGRKSPQLKKADKSTQTVSSHVDKQTPEKRTPSRKGHRRQDSREAASEESKKHTRESRKSLCEANPSSGGTSGKSHHVSRRRSEDRSSKKSESTLIAAAEQRSAAIPSFFTESRPTKDGVTMSRRVSTGDCPKRTSGAFADSYEAKWLKNPVYASDGESEGRRTDRSEMNPPWFDISVAQISRGSCTAEPSDPRAAARRLVKSKKKHVTAICRSTQPNMEAVPETSQPSNSRDGRRVVQHRQPQPRMHQQLQHQPPPPPTAACPVAQSHLSTTDPSILRMIERKLGKPLAELDTASLKTLSEKRMKELKEKYAGNGPRPSPARKE